jgi:hypothetical protein
VARRRIIICIRDLVVRGTSEGGGECYVYAWAVEN